MSPLHRHRTIAAMLLNHFFLCPHFGHGASLRIPEIVILLKRHDTSIARMMLVETINGLNRNAYRGITQVSCTGSPLILFLWLVDKLMMIPPSVIPVTDAVQLERLRHVRYGTPFDIQDGQAIRHVLPWFIQPLHVHEMGGQPVVYLFGIDRIALSIFSGNSVLMHQFREIVLLYLWRVILPSSFFSRVE